MIFGYLMLLIAVGISAIAAYYSVAGLTAIFAAAVLPVIIMGGALEAGKIAATVWLHNNWKRAGIAFKLYLIPAIMFLMLLTSMGIFGFLSKAHLDQNIPTGDAQAKVQIIDDKIATARGNIDSAKTTLKQMDAQVNEMLSRSTDNKGTERAVAIRKQQEKERANLNKIITDNQTSVTALSNERAPLAAEYRKIEAEVGPIKYVAALIYHDNPDANALEAAVRWVIILIVIVFDPLALCLILAANKQLEWARQGKGAWVHEEEDENKAKDTATNVAVSALAVPVVEPPLAPAEEEKQGLESPHSNQSTGELPLPEHPITEEQREQQEQEELERFFWRGRMIARALDADEAERLAKEANEELAAVDAFTEQAYEDLVAQLEADEARYEAELEKKTAEEQALKAKLQEQEQALIDLATEYEYMEGRLHAEIARKLELDETLANTEQLKTDLKSALDGTAEANETLTGDNQRMGQELLRATQTATMLKLQLEQSKQKTAELQGWVDQLQADLRAAMELAQERNEAVKAMQAQIPQPEVTVTEVFPEPEPVTVETPPAELVTDETHDTTAGAELGFTERYFSHKVTPDGTESQAGFGNEFPATPAKGDLFLRVDFLPSRLYKWNGLKWIEVDKGLSDHLVYNQAYIEHLVERIRSGEYDIDDLSDSEKQELQQYLTSQNATL